MKKIFALLLTILMVAFAFGCSAQEATADPTQAPAAATQAPAQQDDPSSTPESDDGAEEEIVSVGWLGPLSGPYASFGTQNAAACELFEYFWEQEGGFKANPNRKLHVEYYDHEGNADVAMALFERVVNDHHAFVFTVTTLPTVACQPLLTRYEKPMMFTGATADRALEEDNPWTFRASAGDKDLPGAQALLYTFLEEKQGYEFKTFACVHGSDDSGVGSGLSWSGVAKEHGMEQILDETIMTSQTTDVSGVINRLKAEKPDLIIGCLATLEAVLFQKALKEYKVDIPVVTSGSGYSDAEFYTSIDFGGADGVVCIGTWAPDCLNYAGDSERAWELYNYCEELTGYPLTEHGALGWVGFASLVLALDEAETLDPYDIIDALNSQDLPFEHYSNWFTLYKGVKYGEKAGRYNQNIHASCIFVQIKDNDRKLILMSGGETPVPNEDFVWPVKPYAD